MSEGHLVGLKRHSRSSWYSMLGRRYLHPEEVNRHWTALPSLKERPEANEIRRDARVGMVVSTAARDTSELNIK